MKKREAKDFIKYKDYKKNIESLIFLHLHFPNNKRRMLGLPLIRKRAYLKSLENRYIKKW